MADAHPKLSSGQQGVFMFEVIYFPIEVDEKGNPTVLMSNYLDKVDVVGNDSDHFYIRTRT